MAPWYDDRPDCYDDGIDHDDCGGCQCPCHDAEHDPDQCIDPGCDC